MTVFSQIFSEGEVQRNQGISAAIDGVSVAAQIDVKTTYADGSARMAILTVVRPELAVGVSVEAIIHGADAPPLRALDLGAVLAGHDFALALTGTDGCTVQVDVLAALADALAHGTASFWQQGPLATQARVEVPLAGPQRLVFDVTAFADGGFAVEAQIKNDGAMEASGGHVAYAVAVTMDGRLAEQVNLDLTQYQGWHKSYSSDGRNGGQGIGGPDEGWLNIRQDIAHLEATGAVAGYDLMLGLDERLLDRWAQAAAAPGWDDPSAARGVTQFMPGTGARPDIGFTTEANTGWLMTQDIRAAAYAMGQAETASVVPWHFWDAQHRTWLGTEAYPVLWTDPRGGTGTPGDAGSRGLTQQPDASSGWTLDAAHQPDLSFVPYLMTGARWMLDNLQAQASWNVMSQWPAVREDGEGLVVQGGQVRGAAWSLRQIDEAAWASPDGSAEKAAFTAASAANWSWLVEQIPVWTQQQGEAHGWLPGDYGTSGALPPWQQDYFASTAIAAANRGNADALTYLEWASNFLVGRFTHAADGFAAHDGAAYLLAISDAGTGTPYQSWSAIGAATADRGWSNGDGWAQSQGDYAQLALATLAGIARLTGSVAAADAYHALLSDAAPFTTAADFMRDPTFALAAPGADPVTPQSPPDAPDMIALSIRLGADAWQGDPLAVVFVDGIEAFRGVVPASHAHGGATLALGAFAAESAHVVTVQFLNDAWGGSAGLDRNLYVEGISIDGVDQDRHAALLWNSDVRFEFEAPYMAIPAPSGPAPLPPAVATPAIGSIGTGPDTLRLGLSGNAFGGDPHFLVLLDGQQVGDVQTAKATHGTGATGYLDVHAELSLGEHTLAVRFLDDAWGGSAAQDRNLYVDSLSVNGVDQNQQASLLWKSDATFRFVEPPRPATGAGGDHLRITVSGDAWEGAPHFLIIVDGKTIDGARSTSANHAQGHAETIDIKGDFGPGAHALAVRFLDDAWGGAADRDRNLYVESVTANGVDLHHHAALFNAGDAIFRF